MRTEYQVPNFRLGSYATGNYFGKCYICAEEFIGDKRASSCLPCALKAVEALQAELKTAQSFSHWESVTVDKLRAELGRAAGSAKWNSEQYADCADKLKTTKAELDRIKPAAQAVVNRFYLYKGDPHYDNLATAMTPLSENES
jgi:hypothetical protein